MKTVRVDLRLNPAESEALDELAGLLRRSRVDSCREAIWGYLRKVRVTGGEVTTRGIERGAVVESEMPVSFVPERHVELDDQEPNPSPLVDARRGKAPSSGMATTAAERIALLEKVRATGTLKTADELEGVWPPKEE